MNVNNKNLLIIFSVILLIIASASSVSALSLLAQFDNGDDYLQIMPGESAEYYVFAVADQGLNHMIITGEFYDVTTGEMVFIKTLFEETTTELFFSPPPYYITPEDYSNLPGNYKIKIKAEEWLNNGYHTSKTTYLELEVYGNRPPVAEFTYIPLNPIENEEVEFVSQSYDEDGYIVLYEWFINNVKVGEGENFDYVFISSGNYAVKLKVTDNQGASAHKTKTVIVAQGPPTGYPVADFNYVPVNPIENELVVFTSTSYDADGTIILEEWDLNNDGVYEFQGHTASKTFSNAGTYTVWLRVTDNDNLQATKSKQVVVSEPGNIPPVANFVHSPLNPEEGELVTFTSTSTDSDGTIVLEQWDLNNDGIYELQGHSVSKTFNAPGTYKIWLKVYDNDGAQDIVFKQIVVIESENIPPVADFVFVPEEPFEDEVVEFTSTSYDVDGEIISYKWYINSELYSFASSFSKIFTAPGTYDVKLIVEDDDGAQDFIIKKVVVQESQAGNIPPVADFIYSPLQPLVDHEVTFTSTSYDADGTIVLYEWFIEGVEVSNAEVMQYIFTEQGAYDVRLRVTDNDGAQDLITKQVNVTKFTTQNIPPIADFVNSPLNPVEGDEVVFTSTSTDSDGFIVSYKWKIDDLVVPGEETMTHTFEEAGYYKIKLNVTDDDGASSEKAKIIRVKSSGGGQSNITIDELKCNPDVVKGEKQLCSAHIKGNLPHVKIIFKYSYNDETLGECQTNGKGYCHITPVINEEPGMYEVYALAYKANYGYDESRNLRTKFRVWEKGYEIKNMKVFKDEFQTESYTFYRSEDMYVSFDIYDIIEGEYVPPGSGLYEEAFLRVNNGDKIELTKISGSSGFQNLLMKIFGTTDNDDGAYKYKLNYIPITDDVLGKGKVFVFVHDSEGKAGQGDKDVEILNNALSFSPPESITIDDEMVLDMKQYTSDIETPDEEIIITWSINPNLEIENEGNNVLKINPSEDFISATILFTASDTDGSVIYKYIKFYRKGSNPCDPVAVLKMRDSIRIGDTILLNGSLSTAGCNATIIKYEWKIYKQDALIETVYTEEPYWYYTFNSNTRYTVVLTIYTSKNLSDSDTKSLFAGRPKQGIVIGKEDKLFIDYFDATGENSPYGTITCGEQFTVTVQVSNERNEDIEDLKITFAIPELGYELEGEKFDLDSGDTETVQIHGYLDMMREEVPPGEYIALIGASDTDTIRNKYFPLIIE